VRLPKEILVLLALLAVMIIGVSWYVIDRRAKTRAGNPPPSATAPR
jgi:zona occludens toxin (predicted ATPase)